MDDDVKVYNLNSSPSGPGSFTGTQTQTPADDLGDLASLAGWGGGSFDISPPQPKIAVESFASVREEVMVDEDLSDLHLNTTPTVSEGGPLMSEGASEQGTDNQQGFGSVREIPISQIFPNPFQPRKTFEPNALKELADSIREHGVIQPVVVTKAPGGFELVVGERRFRASALAGLTTVPAIVKGEMADLAKLEVALIENIQRHELNPIEEAQAYERLIKGFGMKQEEVAKKLGKARPTIANTLRLLNLPAEIQRGIIEGKLGEGHARPILSLPDRNQQLAVYREVLEKGLNARQIEARVRELVSRKSVDGLAPDPRLMMLESRLRGRLGTQVKIQRQGRGGKIMIEFFSEAELEEIVNRMAEQNVSVQRSGEEYITV